MTYLTVQDLAVSYAKTGKSKETIQVVNGLDLSLEKGEIGCFLGYSGCGKTTALRAIAGLEQTQRGQIQLDDKVLTVSGLTAKSVHIPPAKRGMGMVFQDYALFGHLTVADNIAFGLHKWEKSKRNERVAEMLALVGLSEHADKKPSQLSGGQQQRVALARALAPAPKLLLLDEPFSNLDVVLRESLAMNVRDILKRTETTAILVTHDQNEAFALADKVGVMHQGKLEQWATPSQLYHQPATPFVADFIGEGAMLTGTVEQGRVDTALGVINISDNRANNASSEENLQEVKSSLQDGTTVKILIRPDDILYYDVSEDDEHSKNTHQMPNKVMAKVVSRVFRGANYLYQLELADGQRVYALIPSHHDHEVGSEIGIYPNLEYVVVFAESV